MAANPTELRPRNGQRTILIAAIAALLMSVFNTAWLWKTQSNEAGRFQKESLRIRNQLFLFGQTLAVAAHFRQSSSSVPPDSPIAQILPGIDQRAKLQLLNQIPPKSAQTMATALALSIGLKVDINALLASGVVDQSVRQSVEALVGLQNGDEAREAFSEGFRLAQDELLCSSSDLRSDRERFARAAVAFEDASHLIPEVLKRFQLNPTVPTTELSRLLIHPDHDKDPESIAELEALLDSVSSQATMTR